MASAIDPALAGPSGACGLPPGPGALRLPTAAAEMRSFDGTEQTQGHELRLERRRDLSAVMEIEGPFIARGAGLSYCAASMGAGVTSMDATRLDRVLGFDANTGEITVEPGLGVGTLTELLAAKGRWLPPLPGYPTISVGGCVAFDVHGKSQLHSGNFGQWITAMSVIHPAHGELRCSPTRHRDLFDLTIGGMGLTGFIANVTLTTEPLPGQALELEPVVARNLYEAPDMMAEAAGRVDGLYSWHDLTRQTAEFGPGLVFLERFVSSAPAPRDRRGLSIATRAPFAVWRRSIAIIALGGYRALQRPGSRRVLPLRRALFPIEGLEVYYAAFGRQGFREYQLIVPRARWTRFLDALRPLVGRLPCPITLASLKLFDGESRNLAFNGSGVCLALDVPAVPAASIFFAELDELAHRCEAVVNLAKDSRIGRNTCRRLFPEYDRFRAELAAFDPHRRCQSRLRDRIGV